ncbi:hypothetical protein UFOVP1290_106 [uncultured Caudovirales phage]|uniref:Uncharacterized protein n=1 Tax=uncultured Caudovirales phage TaxID=2100421 RepID=A0A6J5RQM9_9CAUD|nr:hypothetical protein UFOVP1290_106 [uncultured Caudovirales phage]
MNLEEFLNYQPKCLACGSSLKTAFHSNKKQNINIINDRFEAKFKLGNLHHKQKHYYVIFSISLKDNSFFVDFYDKYQLITNISISILNRFKTFDTNNSYYQIFRLCKCNKYNYTSNLFKLDYKECSIKDLSVRTEYLELQHHNHNYEIINWHDNQETWFTIINNNNSFLSSVPDMVKIPIINMNNKDYIVNRLNNLLIFT